MGLVAALESRVLGAVLGDSVAWVALWGDPWDQGTQVEELEERWGLKAPYLHSVFPLSLH